MKQPRGAFADVLVAAPPGNKLTYPPPELRTSSPRPELFFVHLALLHLIVPPTPIVACAFASVPHPSHPSPNARLCRVPRDTFTSLRRTPSCDRLPLRPFRKN